jgi:transcriptional regulator with XRE-family HTH domain
MKEHRPPPLGAILRYLRFERGWSETDLAAAAGLSSPSLISEYENGSKELSRERLEELLSLMGVPAEAIDACLYARQVASPQASLGSPVDPTPAEQRSIHRAATQAGLCAFKATQERLTKNVRWRRAARDRRQAEELGKTLMELPPKRWWATVEAEKKYWTWAFAEWLCAASEKAAAHRAKHAMELARLALRVAERVSGSEAWRSLLLGFVWAFVANSRRVHGDLRGAELAFRRSDRLWAVGVPANSGLLDGSRLLDLKASLLRYQGSFEAALALLEEAFHASGSDETRARILVKKANTFELMGENEQALAVLELAKGLAENAQDRRLPWLIRFALAGNLWHLSRYMEGAELLPDLRERVLELGNELDFFRTIWLDGRLAAGLGLRERALASLEEVQRYFTSKKIAFDAALASLEVAVFYLEEGRTREVKRLAEEMYWIFNVQCVAEEVLSVLRLFCEAARKEEVTPDLARQWVGSLQKACHQPQLRFGVVRGSTSKTGGAG